MTKQLVEDLGRVTWTWQRSKVRAKKAYNDFRLSLAYEVKKLYWKTRSTNPEQQTTLQSLP